jgi:hypothetical protein
MKKIKQIIAIMIFFSIPIWMTAQPPIGLAVECDGNAVG